MTTNSPSDRRNTFRLNQDVIFDFRPVDTHTAEQCDPETAFGIGGAMQMMTELRRIDREAQQLLKVISDKQRLIADYLQKLNQKIDLIARQSMFPAGASEQVTRLNISEGGVSFPSDRALYKGNFLVLRLIFLPSYTPVVVFATVCRCDNEGDNRYRIGAQFHRLREQDRQEIARQLIKAQIQHRKRGNTGE